MFLRVYFGLSWLYFAIVLNHMEWLLLFCTATLLLLYLHTSNLTIFKRSFRLLVWLLVPIMILHAVFGTGIYVQLPLPIEASIPISLDGLEHGFFLCLKIMSIFFSALLLARIITIDELYYILHKLPWLGSFLLPYLLLMQPLRVHISQDVVLQKEAWNKKQQKWLHLPDMLLNLIQNILISAKQEANALWSDWETRNKAWMRHSHSFFSVQNYDGIYATFALFIWIIL